MPARRRQLGEIRVTHSSELTPGQLDRVAEIYEQAFAPHHRVPFAELAATGPADMLVAALDSDEPVGFAALRLLDAGRWTFLRYYGIAAQRRSAGLGQRFWQLLRPALDEAGWPGRVAFEVEDPGHAASDEARDVAVARIGFWTRCGCRVLPITGFVMPDITGHSEPEPMLLMASDPARVSWPAAELADLVRAIYARRYQFGPEHPMVVAALASIGDGGSGVFGTENDEMAPSEQAEFRAFVKDGRITAMPVKRPKRLVLLDRVAGLFEIGVHYSEQDVNRILRAVFDDYVALRRYLVDEGFLDRASGEYWRSGGTVSPHSPPGSL